MKEEFVLENVQARTPWNKGEPVGQNHFCIFFAVRALANRDVDDLRLWCVG